MNGWCGTTCLVLRLEKYFRKIHWYSAENRDGEYPSQCHISIQPTSWWPCSGSQRPSCRLAWKIDVYILEPQWLAGENQQFFSSKLKSSRPQLRFMFGQWMQLLLNLWAKGRWLGTNNDLGPIISSLLVSQVIQLTKPPTLCLNQVDEESDSAASAIQDWGLKAWQKKHFMVVLAPYAIHLPGGCARKTKLLSWTSSCRSGKKKVQTSKIWCIFLVIHVQNHWSFGFVEVRCFDLWWYFFQRAQVVKAVASCKCWIVVVYLQKFGSKREAPKQQTLHPCTTQCDVFCSIAWSKNIRWRWRWTNFQNTFERIWFLWG